MCFDPDQLPNPVDYYKDFGLRLAGSGKWRTTCCNFCEFRTMRVNLTTGAYVCTDCGSSGASVLDHHMELTGADETQAAIGLGAWWYTPAPLPTGMEVRHGL